MTLHRCIRVFSLAALLLIVPAGVFVRPGDAMHGWPTVATGGYRGADRTMAAPSHEAPFDKGPKAISTAAPAAVR